MGVSVCRLVKLLLAALLFGAAGGWVLVVLVDLLSGQHWPLGGSVLWLSLGSLLPFTYWNLAAMNVFGAAGPRGGDRDTQT